MSKLYHPVGEPSPGKMKTRAGRAPVAGQRPVTFAELHDATDATVWRLAWLRDSVGSPQKPLAKPKEKDSGDWLNCKLYADPRAQGKANYWIGLSITAQRISARWDAKALLTYRRSLYEAVVYLLTRLKDEQVHQDGFSAYTYMVRPEGECYHVTERPSAALLAKQMQDMLSEQLAALPIGGTLTVPDVAAATAALRGRPYANDFGGIRDLITGEIAVTRHKVTLKVTK